MSDTTARTKHTPGPWEIVQHTHDESSIYGPGKTIVCRLEPEYIEIDEDDETIERPTPEEEAAVEVMDANARLIAAAPDLLVALKAACGALMAHGLQHTANAMLPFIRLADPDYELIPQP